MKKIYFYLTILISSIFIASCSKDKTEPIPECEKNGTATLTISNTTDDTYTLYINDKLIKTLEAGHSLQDILLQKGDHKIYALQKDGYILYPTEFEQLHKAIPCDKNVIYIK